MAVLEDGREPYFRGCDSFMLLNPEVLDNLIIDQLYQRGSSSIDTMVTTLEEAGLVEAEGIVWGALETEVNKRRSKKRGANPIRRREAIAKRFDSWHETRRGAFLRHLIRTNSLNEGGLETVISNMREELYDEVEFGDGKRVAYPRALLDGSLEEVYARRTKVTDGSYEAETIKLKPKHGGDLVQMVLPNTVRRITEPIRISPLITWCRQRKGKRDFVFERSTDIDGGMTFRDGALGALAVAYFSPNVRAGWPPYMSIRGSREQFIGAAQVPVLALMRQAQLLKTDFVEAAEAVAA
jgi:hypothetical protein